MKKTDENDAKKGMDDKKSHQNTDGISKTYEKIDPMGTEVMQEDEYQKEKHGELPEEDQKKNHKK